MENILNLKKINFIVLFNNIESIIKSNFSNFIILNEVSKNQFIMSNPDSISQHDPLSLEMY